MAIIDKVQFDENFQYYDKETINLVIGNFIEESEERLNSIEKNISEGNFGQLAFNAHSLKSVIGNFMAPEPYEVCRKLEEMAKLKSEIDIHQIFTKLKILTSGLISELKDYLGSNK